MAVNASDLLSTPENYATPKQLEAMREFYGGMLKGGTDLSPIQSKWQGISRMVQALVGGIGTGMTGERERKAKLADAGNVVPQVPSSSAVPPLPGVLGGATPGYSLPGDPARKAAMGFNPEMEPPPPTPPKSIGGVELGPNTPGSILGRPGESIMPFNGEPTNLPPPGAPGPMAQALAAPGPNSVPMPRSVPTVPGGPDGSSIPPGVIPTRPRYTEQQIRQIMAADYISPEMKQQAMQMYLMQDQPVELQGMGGKYLIGRDGKPYYIPDVKWVPNKAGAAETQVPTIIDKSGKMQTLEGQPPAAGGRPPITQDVPNLQYAAPQGGKADMGKGIMNEMPPLPPEIMTGQSAQPPAASKIPVMPDFEADRPPPPAPLPPDTTHGINRDLKGDRIRLQTPEQGGKGDKGGLLKYAPDANGVLSQADIPPAPRPGTEGKLAQNTGSPTLDRLMNQSLDYEARKHANEKEIDAYQKQTDLATAVGQRAASSRSMLEMARKLVDSDEFKSGVGQDPMLDIQRLKQRLFGGNAATSNEAFTKIISGQLLEDMKISLQGLGQVRVAEIDLLSKAAANQYMTKGANRMVLDLMIKAHDKAANIGKITAGYQAGARWDKDGKVMKNADGSPKVFDTPPKLGELNGLVNKYLDKNPILTQEEQGHLQKLIESKHEYGAVQQDETKGKYAKERPQPKAMNPPPPPARRPATAPPAGYE